MTKENLINILTVKTGIDRKEVTAVIEGFFTTVKYNVGIEGNDLELRGFGSFRIVRRKPKKARNIKANLPIVIPAHNEVRFYPSKFFKVSETFGKVVTVLAMVMIAASCRTPHQVSAPAEDRIIFEKKYTGR